MELLGTGKFSLGVGSPSNLMWAWAKKDKRFKSKTALNIYSSYSGCRENATEYLRSGTPGFFSYMDKSTDNRVYLVVSQPRPASFTKSGVIVNKKLDKATEEKFINWMRRAVKLLNAYEKELKWPLSKMDFPEHKSGTNHFAVFTSSRKWLRSPVASSFYTLIIRICSKQYSMRLRKPTSILKGILSNKSTWANGNDHVYTLKLCIWGMAFLKNLDKIYGNRKALNIWKQEGYSYGMNQFLSPSSSGQQATNFVKICKEEGLPDPQMSMNPSVLKNLMDKM